MEKRGISQEGLKIIACVTMLMDHVGAVFYPGQLWIRAVGRIAFPIYCFLLAEGAHYTSNPSKYALRLFVGLLLSELPFDYALKGKFTLANQSVMFTLLFGFLAIEAIGYLKNDFLKLAISAAAIAAGQYLHTDYGGYGVALIILLSQCRGNLVCQTGVLLLIAWAMNSLRWLIFGYRIPIEMFAVFAMIPIAFYSGKKSTSHPAVQWAFYLFYPVHLAIIAMIRFHF